MEGKKKGSLFPALGLVIGKWEEWEYRKAVREAGAYMERVCSYGREPDPLICDACDTNL